MYIKGVEKEEPNLVPVTKEHYPIVVLAPEAGEQIRSIIREEIYLMLEHIRLQGV